MSPPADPFFRGLQLLTQIIIADITTLKWRGLVSSLTSTPFIINAFVGANISTGVLQHAGWRWGCACFLFYYDIMMLIFSRRRHVCDSGAGVPCAPRHHPLLG